jgi:peptide-methionine (R)-S-oxide reductase
MRWKLFIFAAAVLAAGAIFWLQRSPKAPEPTQGGSGSEVTLILFSDTGARQGPQRVRRIIQSDAEWRRQLSSEQFAVTRQKSTEYPFHNLYWKEQATGIYRCICCGNAVFRSREKFDSDTGWPSFWVPIAPENIATATDISLPTERTEVLCRKCNAHLGHVFDDGPPPTGLRYCLNSAALRLVRMP